MRTFGLSAPGKVVSEHFGFTSENVVKAARAQLTR
jgi:transketolase